MAGEGRRSVNANRVEAMAELKRINEGLIGELVTLPRDGPSPVRAAERGARPGRQSDYIEERICYS